MAGINQAGLVTAFPHGARASVSRVEKNGVVACEGVHQSRPRSRSARRQQQVHLVAHHYIGMQSAIEPGQRLPRTLQVSLAIIVIQKARQTVVASVHNVLRYACKVESRMSGHAQASPVAQRRAIGDCR